MIIDFIDLKAEHIPEVLELMKDFYAIDNYPIDKEISQQNFQYFINQPSAGKSFVITCDNQIAGYIIIAKIFSFEFGGYIWLLDELYIDDKYRGKSIGKIAVDFIKAKSLEEHIPVVLLEVENHNERAVHLYESKGFEKHKRSLMILNNKK